MKLSKQSINIIIAIGIISVSAGIFSSPAMDSAVGTDGSTGGDPLFVPDTIESEVEAELDSISYVADSIYYDVENETIYLSGGAELTYHDASIKAGDIMINLADDQAYTSGETWMRDGTQILVGSTVSYDFISEKGIVYDGASRLEKGYYYGEEIRKVGEDVYDVDKGYFTTCDIEEPHFYIYSRRMRLYHRDRIAARPLIFYVNHFPIMMLPFATFPVKTERASGILVPEPGYNSTDGKYIENIALYYGQSEYFDILAAMDWREYTGWEARIESDYIRRYIFSGNFLARYQHRRDNQHRSRREWYVRARHRHDFIDRSSLDANLEFMSSRDVWEGSEDIDERLAERITSTVAYRKPFRATTLNIGSRYTEDLLQDTKQITLPSVSYSLPSKPVYELFTSPERPFVDRWWHSFNYSYSLRGIHTGNITKPSPSLAEVLYKNVKDEDGQYLAQHNVGLRHAVGMSFNRTLGGWLNFSQSISGNEVWFDRDREGNTPARGFDYSTNTGLSHSIYGIANFPDFPVRAVRHIMTPSLNFSYSPDYTHRQNKYYSFGGIGLSSASKRRNLSFSLNHRWSLKYFDRQAERERALNDFWTVSSSISYDFEKEDKPFSEISHSTSLRPGSFTLAGITFDYSTRLSARQDAYNFDLLNWRVNNTLRIGGDASYRDYFPQQKNVFFTGEAFQPQLDADDVVLPDDISPDDILPQDSLSEDISREDFPPPAGEFGQFSGTHRWNLNLSHDYSKNLDTGRRTHNLRSSVAFRLTDNWSIDYSNYYNIEDSKMISQSVSIERDLRCWKLAFSWSKQGDYWHYRIQLFNITLPDILRVRSTQYKRDQR